jgi:hypothetical protein
MQISPDDLVILQGHPDYDMPAETFLDFEQGVHQALGDDGDENPETGVKEKTRVCIQVLFIR